MTSWREIVSRARGAWAPLGESERTEVWNRFEAEFDFKPSTKASDWPVFREPVPSVTYAIGHAYDNTVLYERLTSELCEKILAALRACVSDDGWIYVLDWQHPGYKFWPHKPFAWSSEDDWPVAPFPDGDYFIFIAADFAFGTLGQPWEESICVFGDPLLTALRADPPAILDRPIRRDAHAV